MLGVGVHTGEIRYDLLPMVLAAVASMVTVLGALLVAGRVPTTLRLILGGLIAGLGAGLAHFLGMSSVGVQGSVQLNIALAAAAAAVGVVSMSTLLWGASRLDNMFTLTGVALLFAITINVMHYIGLAGVQVHLDPMAVQPSGRDLFTLFVPVFVLGTLSMAIPITAVLVAPDRSGRPQPAGRAERPVPQPVG
jgi:NO-binding membrane sensor protein with MHYT domain